MRLRHLLLALLLPIFGYSQTVVEVIVNSPDHETLEAAVIAAELNGVLSGDGPFTVFAPTDDAFAALPAGTVETLLEDPAGDLTQILLYHVLSGQVNSGDLSDGMMATTINGADITVGIAGGVVTINGATVTTADVPATNGVVHVIDAVLLPPAPENVLDVVVNSPVHNTLQAAVEAAGLADALSGPGPLTVFAPTDDAFAALPAGTVESLLEDPQGALTDVLLYHVVADEATSGDLFDGDLIATLNRKGVQVSIMNGNVMINDAMVTVADIITPNGVVHVIDAVLVPNFSIMDIVEDSEVHTTLEAAIDAAELTTILHSDDIEVTLFAPTDDAFAALPAGTVEALLEDPQGSLFDVLLFHVTSGSVLAEDLTDGMSVTTGFGKQATITFQDDKVFIDNAEIVMTNLEADNGVVHVIDAVLTPPTTVVDRVNASPDHTILASLLEISGLNFELNADAELTLFAPNDEAISALGQNVIDILLENSELLETILVYHVIADASIEASEITDGATPTTPLDLDILLNLEEGNVVVNQDGIVDAADITADNGVVHSITSVLIPVTTGGLIGGSDAFTTLTTALAESGLIDIFTSTDNRHTVFAPTNAAFDALPAGTLETLLDDPTGELATILATHAVDGRVFSNQLSDQQVVTTLSGEEVTVTIDATGVFINNAQVIQTDVFTGNGLIHVIDAVIQDDAPGTVVDVIVNSPVHNTLEAAVVAADLVETLSGEGPFTVFAPTDEAFDALPEGLLETLLEMPAGDLTTILTYHVVGSTIESSSLSDGDTAPTLQGESVAVTINTDGVFINDAQVVTADIPASNGIVHAINGVLLPGAITNTIELPADAVDVVPSVTTDLVKVSYSNDDLSAASIYVFDNMGKLVLTQQSVRSGESVDLSELTTGAYFMTITDGEKAATKRVTKI